MKGFKLALVRWRSDTGLSSRTPSRSVARARPGTVARGARYDPDRIGVHSERPGRSDRHPAPGMRPPATDGRRLRSAKADSRQPIWISSRYPNMAYSVDFSAPSCYKTDHTDANVISRPSSDSRLWPPATCEASLSCIQVVRLLRLPDHPVATTSRSSPHRAVRASFRGSPPAPAPSA